MDDLHVNRWRKNGQDRLYVNLGGPRGQAVAWLNMKTGEVTIEVPEYESAARQALKAWQHDQRSEPRPAPAPLPPRLKAAPTSIPPLPPLTRDNDLARNPPGAAVADKVREIESQRSALVRLVARGLRLSLGADDWRTGLEGEQAVGESLEALKARGWRILHAVRWPSGADIDHMAIGPAGVFTINSKHHPDARVWVGDHVIRVNNRTTDHVRFSLNEADRTAKLLRYWCGWPVSVQPVIAIVGAAGMKITTTAPPVLVVDGLSIAEHLASLPQHLPEYRVSSVFEVARRADVWKATQKRRWSDRQL
ncbi:nuclease-related domain-containing protein [Actinacidiphila sp. DG2A-62]|uniref:nuclease-related domain-containing protein n=1 Tax=Actinacidiphila sp. DG2A-62 TaxID=3108821 RepID=UPI002DBC682B|nr:nuclease-related domain-containing protein [Actinacidiphila sp. DG2A-62]MEC3998017.1 nuclease-related domain-containing protein [Actinacidiphila sp. DG2A-62]